MEKVNKLVLGSSPSGVESEQWHILKWSMSAELMVPCQLNTE